MRVLIVYSSRHGHTERVAQRIAATLTISGSEPHVFAIDDVPRNIVLRLCDAVVIAGAVHFGKFDKKLTRFVAAHRDELAKLQSCFVAVSGAAAKAETMNMAEDAVAKFVALTGWKPSRILHAAGGEPYTKYGFFTKWIMSRIARSQGRVVDTHRDYDFTDWQAVDHFARDLAGQEREVAVTVG